MTEVAAIEFAGVSKDYGALKALDSIDLRIEQGEVFGFLGPNGAGKTTAIRILLDLIRPSTGTARVLGFDCQRNSVEARRHAGYLPGELRLYDTLSGRETVDLFARLRGGIDDAYLRTLCERFGLDLDRPVGQYSKGNRQKLGLVLAMMHQPEVLILDEPTSGLDPLVQIEVAAALEEQAAQGRTVFFSSHVLSEVERMCRRVAIIRQGRIVTVEDVATLKGRSLHIIEVTFAAPVPADAFDLPGVREIEREGNVVHLEVHDNLDAVIKAVSLYPIVDLRTEQPSLEHIFLAYYEGKEGQAR